MLQITFHYTLQELIENLNHCIDHKDHYNIWSNLTLEIVDGWYGLSFKINGGDIFKSDTAYTLWFYLGAINDAFFQLLNGNDNSSTKIPFNLHGAGGDAMAEMKKNKDKLFFIPTKQFPNINQDPCDLKQAVEEVMRVIEEYKKIFWQAAQIKYPQDPQLFMYYSFGKDNQYTKDLLECSDDVLKNRILATYKSKDLKEIESKTIIIKRAYSTEEFHKFRKLQDDPITVDKLTHYILVRDYYLWQPLETAWKEYQSKHN